MALRAIYGQLNSSAPFILPRHEQRLGFRIGARGTHTSRTLMFAELAELLNAIPSGSSREVYAGAVIDENVTGKRTAATRLLTNQRLGELYALDPNVTLFRVMRRYWDADQPGRRLLALLCSLARDPLLRATVSPITALDAGKELGRQALIDAVRLAVDERLNDAIIDKVVRNAASSWTQAGHLAGRVRKLRKHVIPTPHSVAYALLIGYLLGIRGNRLFTTFWASVLDASEEKLIFLAMDAKRLGALNLKHGGGVIEVDFTSILTSDEIRESRGTD
ncbi:hypothetical protein RAS2_29070 [Phycisphaerae bacterium RAS2]|nr:hypothetical protein RAS2_29070 [Phycisphaerae bacterium RAS2]